MPPLDWCLTIVQNLINFWKNLSEIDFCIWVVFDVPQNLQATTISALDNSPNAKNGPTSHIWHRKTTREYSLALDQAFGFGFGAGKFKVYEPLFEANLLSASIRTIDFSHITFIRALPTVHTPDI